MFKKFKLLTSIILAFAMMLSAIACQPASDESEKKTGSATSFVSLDVNPEIELTLDENDVVLSVHGANEDARVLLLGEVDLKGKTLDEAVEIITELAVELGYLSEDNKVVATNASSADGERVKALIQSVNAKIEATSQKLGLTVKTDSEGVFSLVRKYEQFKQENPNNQLIQSLSIEKFNLAMTASETGEVSLEVAVTLDDKELIEMISSVHKEIEIFATDAYNKVKAQAFLIYDRAVSTVLDNVYSNYYLKNITSHITTAWYGHAYQAYKSMARGFGDLSKLMVYVEKSASYPIDEALVQEAFGAVGIEDFDVEKLKDSDGNITLNSIEGYLDVFFKNVEESDDVQALKTQVIEIISGIEEGVLTDVKAEIKKLEPQINTIVTSVETALAAIKGATAMYQSMLVGFDDFVTSVEGILVSIATDVANGEISSAKLGKYSEEAEKKSAEMLTKIEADLSEEELKELNAEIAELEKTLSDARQSMEDAISAAEQDIKDRLAELKEERKSKEA